jgi:hypothetical protein
MNGLSERYTVDQIRKIKYIKQKQKNFSDRSLRPTRFSDFETQFILDSRLTDGCAVVKP